MVLGGLIAASLLGLFFANSESWIGHFIFERPESFLGLAGYWLAYGSAYLGLGFICLLLGFVFPLIVASPFYDYVSMKVEESVTGKKAAEMGFVRSILLMGEELKKVLFVLFCSIIALFIPLLNIVVPVWMMSWEFYDYPLVRRGLSFRERLNRVGTDFFEVLGFSVWFLIPFVQVLLIPLAVAGASLLAVESIENRASC